VADTDATAVAAADDSELMQQVASGSTGAFEELYERYHGRAYRLARSVCGEDGRAEEAVQEAFVSIWRSAATYETSRGAVAGWLLTVVHRRALDVVRADTTHANHRADADGIELHPVSGVAERVVDRDDATRLGNQLGWLPDVQREVIALAFYGQLSHAEIAAQLQLPEGTVKGRMRLGLQKLRVGIEHVAACERWHAELTKAFYLGDLDRARRVVRDAVNDMPVVSMLDDVLAPAMHSIGALWQRDEITIADEHLATAICLRLLAETALALQVAPAKTRQTVLLATPAPEQHTFGLLMANDVLYGAGYDAVMLGGGVPDTALSAALLRHQPALVALSSTMAFPNAFAATCGVIHETLPAAQLIVGGAAARRPLPTSRRATWTDSTACWPPLTRCLTLEQPRGQRPPSARVVDRPSRLACQSLAWGWRKNGRGEIRTPETRVTRLPVFKTGAFNRSATLPSTASGKASRSASRQRESSSDDPAAGHGGGLFDSSFTGERENAGARWRLHERFAQHPSDLGQGLAGAAYDRGGVGEAMDVSGVAALAHTHACVLQRSRVRLSLVA
jgi:RNA polymerase sigma-70 factor, ECF subfamily